MSPKSGFPNGEEFNALREYYKLEHESKGPLCYLCPIVGLFRVSLVIDMGCQQAFVTGWIAAFGTFMTSGPTLRLHSLVRICTIYHHYIKDLMS